MTEAETGLRPLARVPSGVVGIDAIIRGGFLQGGIYLMVGQPGAGKTILANQICFHHIASGGRAVYFTLLAETHARMFAHLQSLSFFDLRLVGDALQYFSGYATLEKDGLRGLLDLIRQVIKEQRTTLLILDGISTAESAAESDLAFKRFVQTLQVMTQLSKCTTVMLVSPSADPLHAEYTMVDGVFELHHQLAGSQVVRDLYVPKFRGSGYLEGRHSYTITSDGVVVYPKLEALFPAPLAMRDEPLELVPFGITGLDDMLGGGVPASSTTMVFGSPGSGKTLLGLHFLMAGVRDGEQALLFGFYETPPRLIRKSDLVGLPVRDAVDQGLLEITWRPPIANLLDELGERLLASVERRQIRRLFIDGLSGLQAAAPYPDRFFSFLTALTNELRARNVTTLCSVELRELFGPAVQLPIDGVSAIVDNTFFLRHVELQSQLYRLLSIINVRERGYDSAIREFRITNRGIEVAATFASAEAILTGVARPRDIRRPTSARTQRRTKTMEGASDDDSGR